MPSSKFAFVLTLEKTQRATRLRCRPTAEQLDWKYSDSGRNRLDALWLLQVYMKEREQFAASFMERDHVAIDPL